eukprot:NODE_4312_length_675_cov_19.618211_g3671_i0.p3 GENE.NODE_4312_length_675_cov_19.618211_g3671_i0~~NODE_4312_length_675_cov_19.618211_g3671_i0.p3  ORF type:complete len:51 (-),score=8.24 NODE_4312_length_675_cov_19.618211_g3671_i0:521-673(-)
MKKKKGASPEQQGCGWDGHFPWNEAKKKGEAQAQPPKNTKTQKARIQNPK